MIAKNLAALGGLALILSVARSASTSSATQPAALSEWWSVSGHAATKAGRKFRWHASLFRFALGDSEGFYSAEFSVLDVRTGRLESEQRSARESVASAGRKPRSIAVDGWHITTRVASNPLRAPMDILFESSSAGFSLHLLPQKPPVASLAFRGLAFTRLKTMGLLRYAGTDYMVKGSAWLDHEYETASQPVQRVGWERFELQLDDGRDVELFSSRLRDGNFHLPSQRSGAPEVAAQQTIVGSREPMEGLLVDRSGVPHRVSSQRIELIVRGNTHWHSPHDDAVYPALWQLTLDNGATVAIEPTARDQEIRPEPSGVALWYGAVDLTQADPPGLVLGTGFVQLSGYVTPTAL